MLGTNVFVNVDAKGRFRLDRLARGIIPCASCPPIPNTPRFSIHRGGAVFLAAAKVGGIFDNNTYPADFIYSNLCIQTNTIHSAYIFMVRKLLFLGSSCTYPKFAEQPMKESCLLASELEPTNEPYALPR